MWYLEKQKTSEHFRFGENWKLLYDLILSLHNAAINIFNVLVSFLPFLESVPNFVFISQIVLELGFILCHNIFDQNIRNQKTFIKSAQRTFLKL